MQERQLVGLPGSQEEDLWELFIETVKDKTLDEIDEYFRYDSQTLADFLIKLENTYDWFDWKNTENVLDEICLFILDLEEWWEKDDIEWAEDDEEYFFD